MDKVLTDLKAAVAANKKIELRGIGPKLGHDRLTLLWRTLKEGGYIRKDSVELSRNVFNETWVRRVLH